MRKNSVRPFDWRDLGLVKRLQSGGQVLDYERACVTGLHPLKEALKAYLLLGIGPNRTIVLPKRAAFVQFYYQSEERVRLSYAAPALSNGEQIEIWLDLMEGLTRSVGGPGAHRFIAEARQGSLELEALRRAGFGIFARQELFCLKQANVRPASPALNCLRPWRSSDNWGIRLLYANTVPHLAQRIEPPPSADKNSRWQKGFVLEQDNEIIAFVAVWCGRCGNALRLLLHPEADLQAEALIAQGLAALAPIQHPVYCRVRHYQGWLQGPLQAIGFEPVERMAMLVKHTVIRTAAPVWQHAPVVEGRAEMTTPYPVSPPGIAKNQARLWRRNNGTKNYR